MNSRIIIAILFIALLAPSCRHHKESAYVAADELYEPSRPAKGAKPAGKKPAPTGIADSRRAVVAEARRWLGVKYRYGGESHSGTDCSGMVMKVFEKSCGKKLPRDSRSQQEFCRKINKNELIAGDLVFFSSKAGGSRVSHVGIYIGHYEFIHASTSKGVIVSSLDEPYYTRHYHSAGRVLEKGK